MALTADPKPTTQPAAAYVVHPSAHEIVRALLQRAGLTVRQEATSPTQFPRYTVASAHALRVENDELTEREMQVLQLIAHGHTNPAIGKQMFLGGA